MLPELTILAKNVKRFYEYLVIVQDEAAKTDLEFIIKELLIVAEMCDFSDEVGRRAVIDVVGNDKSLISICLDDILTNLEISEPVLEAAIKLLNSVCTQQEFLIKVTELVSSFRDVYEQPSDADTLHHSLESLDINSTVPEHLRILANLKALDIIKHAMCTSDFGLQPEMAHPPGSCRHPLHQQCLCCHPILRSSLSWSLWNCLQGILIFLETVAEEYIPYLLISFFGSRGGQEHCIAIVV